MSLKCLKPIAIPYGIGIVLLILLLHTRSQPTSEPIPKAPLIRKKRTASRPVGSKYPIELARLRAFEKSEFYRTLVDNNLFRPLGWRPPRPMEPYRLLGTIRPSDGQTGAQAILQSNTTRTTHIVCIGDTLDTDTTVTDIQPKQVTLSESSVMRTLNLNTTPLIK